MNGEKVETGNMKALIGLTLKKARERAKQELGVKRMGDARFKMILDKGIKNGDFIVVGDTLKDPSQDDPFDLIEESVDCEEKTPSTKSLHPEVAHLDPKLSRSDLPRPGDLYHYRSYSGEIVQGEVKSVVCFTECMNPNGTWQAVAFQDLYLKKKSVAKETMLNHLNAFYQNNNHLLGERDRLLKEINQLKEKVKASKDTNADAQQ